MKAVDYEYCRLGVGMLPSGQRANYFTHGAMVSQYGHELWEFKSTSLSLSQCIRLTKLYVCTYSRRILARQSNAIPRMSPGLSFDGMYMVCLCLCLRLH